MDVARETVETNRIMHGALMVGPVRTPLSLQDGIVLNKIDALKGILIQNVSDSLRVYVGGERVSESNGIRLRPNDVFIVPCNDPEHIWVVSTDVGAEVRWILV